ncbi:unnamed protein product, partial [Mycena citricolor]
PTTFVLLHRADVCIHSRPQSPGSPQMAWGLIPAPVFAPIVSALSHSGTHSKLPLPQGSNPSPPAFKSLPRGCSSAAVDPSIDLCESRHYSHTRPFLSVCCADANPSRFLWVASPGWLPTYCTRSSCCTRFDGYLRWGGDLPAPSVQEPRTLSGSESTSWTVLGPFPEGSGRERVPPCQTDSPRLLCHSQAAHSSRRCPPNGCGQLSHSPSYSRRACAECVSIGSRASLHR